MAFGYAGMRCLASALEGGESADRSEHERAGSGDEKHVGHGAASSRPQDRKKNVTPRNRKILVLPTTESVAREHLP
jgi:hypothetical protein